MLISKGINIGDRPINPSADTHPEWSAAFAKLYDHEIIGASALGKLHIRDKTPRDDAFTVKSLGEWVAVAVSDGLGSHKKSRYGSSFAANVLCEALLSNIYNEEIIENESSLESNSNKKLMEPKKASIKKSRGIFKWLFKFDKKKEEQGNSEQNNFFLNFDIPNININLQDRPVFYIGNIQWFDKILYEHESITPPSLQKVVYAAFEHTHGQLRKYAQIHNLSMKEIGCTLLGMIINLKTGEMAVGQVGDGLIAALKTDKKAIPLLETDIPEEGGSTTYIITSSLWKEHFSSKTYEKSETQSFKSFFLMTDGVENDCTNPPPEDIFDRWANDIDREMRVQLSTQEKAAKLLQWLANYTAPASWDDRTLVLIMKDEKLLSTIESPMEHFVEKQSDLDKINELKE